ncbi:MAG: amidophosphoribosyltransferase [Chloroflexi bacterium]|nr:amidophosphoribosyltransferase [Chloroflexota bacterium]
MCGVSGIWQPVGTEATEAARTTFFALYALQHRGQESAGIASTDGSGIHVVKRMGLVGQVFAEPDLASLRGHAAIGHTRYSTTGSSRIENAQPIVVRHPDLGELALGHNGNCINARDLREGLAKEGVTFVGSSDTEVLAQEILKGTGATWEEKMVDALPKLEGAWSLSILTPTAMYGVRDPLGVRPLCLGRKGDAWYLASETCALDTVGASFVRDVEPGEIVRIDEHGPRRVALLADEKRGLCVFEHVYLASVSSSLGGASVYSTRERMGERLSIEHPVAADVVVPVPDSAIPAAVGYARASGIPFREGLIKNRYIGRTFIQPSQALREHSVALKYNALRDVLDGKRVIVIDDSIVRGSTSGPIVNLLRRNGATEVHFRVCSPPIRHACYFGVDMARKRELIAANMDVEQIRKHIGADSLGYLSLEGMVTATGGTVDEMCTACFTGEYPVPVQLELSDPKQALERV